MTSKDQQTRLAFESVAGWFAVATPEELREWASYESVLRRTRPKGEGVDDGGR